MDWPKSQNTQTATDDRSPGTYPTGWFVTLTANASANTKGSYQQIVASAPINADGLILTVSCGSASSGYLVDVAVGAGGSEQVIVPNFPFQDFRLASGLDCLIFLPIKIYKGQRVAMRCQAGTGSQTLGVSVNFLASGFSGIQPPQRWEAAGVDTTASTGTSTATSGTPSFVQLTAATSFSYRFAYLCMLNGQSDDYEWGFAIGTQLVWTNVRTSGTGYGVLGPIPWSVPGGSQLQSKVRSVNSTTVRTMIMGGG